MAKPLEFKGRMLSLTRVRVLDPDVAAIDMQLAEFARQMPQAVAGMPVIIESDQPFDVGVVLASLRGVGMQPLAVTDGVLNESARMWGLAVLPPDTGKGTRIPSGKPASAEAVAPAPAPAAAAAPAARRSAKIVTEPLRGGQQVYAPDADLILTNTVNPGSEAIADGCVHVYAALRGRAIAGAKGDTAARVFCRRFEAELVAVAGVYAVAEQMHGDLRGKPVQAYLADGKLKIERLDW